MKILWMLGASIGAFLEYYENFLEIWLAPSDVDSRWLVTGDQLQCAWSRLGWC